LGLELWVANWGSDFFSENSNWEKWPLHLLQNPGLPLVPVNVLLLKRDLRGALLWTLKYREERKGKNERD